MISTPDRDVQAARGGTGTLEPEAIQEQGRRVLESRLFRNSPRLAKFFSYTVEQAISGSDHRLKEYTIALEVFGKPDSFDPRMDSAVRVAARQLRGKVDLYYITDGAHDPVLIRHRPGDYVPRFYARTDGAERTDGHLSGHAPSVRRVATVVHKDRATVRALIEGLDLVGVSVGAVLDSGEKLRDILPGMDAPVVITGVDLAGALGGAEVISWLHDTVGAPAIAVVPPALDGDLLYRLIAAEPDALVYQPVRPSDVASALRIAVTRRDGVLTDQHTQAEPICA